MFEGITVIGLLTNGEVTTKLSSICCSASKVGTLIPNVTVADAPIDF